MNILILTQCFPPVVGGIENMMGAIAHALHAGGHQVTVLADGRKTAFDADLPFPVRRFSSWKPIRRQHKANVASDMVREGQFDRIIADSWKSVSALDVRTTPITVLAHGSEFPARPSAEKTRRIQSALSKARIVAANSRFTAAIAAPTYVDQSRMRIVTLAIPPQPDADPERVAARRAGHGDGPHVVSLCRLEPRKGVDKVITAIADLRAAYPGITLHVAGDGADRERLETHARTSGIADAVIFHGWMLGDEKAALLSLADVFAMPSRREGSSVEGFGLVYLEAGWYGVPSIAGLDGGAADAVLDGQTGLLCDGADQTAVTDALRRLLSDAALRERLGHNAAGHARRETWPSKIDAYLGLNG